MKRKIYTFIIAMVLLFSVIIEFIFAILLPNSTGKYLVLFYIGAVIGILIEILITIYKKRDKDHPSFKDVTWQSYTHYCIILTPLIVLITTTGISGITKKNINVEWLLQVIYWAVAASSFTWFLYHFLKANTSNELRRINSLLKLFTCIISAIGFVMEIVNKMKFTKQFIVMAWMILFMSYLSDTKNDG